MRNIVMSLVCLTAMGSCGGNSDIAVQSSNLGASAAPSVPDADEFVGQARSGRVGSGATILATLNSARHSAVFIADLCKIAKRALPSDPSAGLVPLALLGEAKTPPAIECLASFLTMPWPSTGKCVGEDPTDPCGVISEQVGLAKLQSKAIEGLAFYRTAATDAIVLRTVSDHPDRGVRARAASAFMWNHDGNAAARDKVLQFVRAGEEGSVDRVIKQRTADAGEFDQRLRAAYGISTTNRR